MDSEKLIQDAMNLARKAAESAFRRHPNRDELIDDTVSSAWEFAVDAPADATPGSIAHYAVKRVKSNRQFQWSVRTVDHPMIRQEHNRESIDWHDYAKVGVDPAIVVMVKIDVSEWLESLSIQKRTFARLASLGYSTSELARLVKVTPGRVSQIRRELMESYREFTEG